VGHRVAYAETMKPIATRPRTTGNRHTELAIN